MSADKHPSDVLADLAPEHRDGLWLVAVLAMLRRIPALEAERDEARLTVLVAQELVTKVAAERDKLRAEVEALRDDCENARRLARLVCDALNVPILHDAPAAIEALRADAERYRKLRAQNHTKTPMVLDPFEPGLGYLPHGLDAALDAIPNDVIGFAAIDAARKQQ